jgi:signal transduction histidine kinase
MSFGQVAARMGRHLWPPTPENRSDPAERTEERMAKGMTYVRAGMVPIQFLPLLSLHTPFRVALGLGAALVAGAEAFWLYRRVLRRRTLQDPLLIGVDLGCSLLLILAGRVAAGESEQMNRVLPFVLATSGFLGFGLGFTRRGMLAITCLALAWALSTTTPGMFVAPAPAPPVKLISDIVGIYLWYFATILIAREFREMADETRRAQQETERIQQEVAERIRQADIARERERTHREIHDHLLPIVDFVAAARPVTPGVLNIARKEASRARRLLQDGREAPLNGLEAQLTEVRDLFIDAGLVISSVLKVSGEPPADVSEAVAHAAREALRNALKHSGCYDGVDLITTATARTVEIVVRDRGAGFDPAMMRPGGGFTQTYEAVRRRGGQVEVESAPGRGTTVFVRWAAGALPDVEREPTSGLS